MAAGDDRRPPEAHASCAPVFEYSAPERVCSGTGSSRYERFASGLLRSAQQVARPRPRRSRFLGHDRPLRVVSRPSASPGFQNPQPRRGSAKPHPVRSPLGRDGRNPMTRMGAPPGLGRPGRAGFGLGSVGEGGSVGAAKTRSASSAYSHRTGLSVVLKIRVSMVRFRPWPPFPTR